MQIKFEIPCNDFDPLSISKGFIKIPRKPGIYIWGYWIWIDGQKTFCPMNVGESGTLQTRLIEHYCTHFDNKDDGTAAFFEVNNYMSQESINELYKQLGTYNDLPKESYKRLKSIEVEKRTNLSKLIFYQNKDFFDFDINTKEKNIGVYSLIKFLENKKSKGKLVHGELLNKIIERQEIHSKNFFCIYATLPIGTDAGKRKIIENTVNKALREKLGIATIADSKNNFEEKIAIDLSKIRDRLVKISSCKILNKWGNYHGKLIIR